MSDFLSGICALSVFLLVLVLTAEFLHAWLESGRYNWRERGPSVIGPGEHPAVRVDERSIREQFDREGG